MAIRDGEAPAPASPASSASTRPPTRRARLKRPPAENPGFFLRSLIPSSNVIASVSCCLIPSSSHLSAVSPASSTPTPTHRAPQLAVAIGSRLELYTIDVTSEVLNRVSTLQLFSSIRDLRTVSCPSVQLRDVLVVLLERNHVAFVQFHLPTSRLRIVGYCRVLNFTDTVKESRLLSTHPQSPICAVASLSSTIAVFPVLFLGKDVYSGKVTDKQFDGVVLGMDFVEHDDYLSNGAILLVLLQEGDEQWIAVYSITEQNTVVGGGGGLSLEPLGSMITCSERPDETAVARHTAKINNTPLQAPAEAHGIARIPGAPYLFSVFLEGRIVVADARPVVMGALEAREGPPLTVRVRSEAHALQYSSRWDEPLPVNNLLGGSSSANPEFSNDSAVRPLYRTTNLFPPVNLEEGSGQPPLPQRSGLTAALRGKTDPYLYYLYVPSSISLDLGSGEGVPTAWTSALDHFSTRDQLMNEDGLYVVVESGALFALRWSASERKGAFIIPPLNGTSRRGPRLSFSVEYCGHVGPSISISALDKKLLYIANESADCSLRHVVQTKDRGCPGTDPKWASEIRFNAESLFSLNSLTNIGYRLDVRQEFLNLSPISDFIVVPAGGVEGGGSLKIRRVLSRMRLRTKDYWTPSSSYSPSVHSRRSPKAMKSPSTPVSGAKSEPDAFQSDRTLSPDQSSCASGGESTKFRPQQFSEPEILVCCGLQKTGTVRVITPGTPVTVFSSSSRDSFQGCNDMWSVRLSAQGATDNFIVLSFFESTRVLFSVPSFAVPKTVLDSSNSANSVAHLLDASASSNIQQDVRSIAVGRLENGLVAQVHSSGVRTIQFMKKSELTIPLNVRDGYLCEPLAKRCWDWKLPPDQTITTAAIGIGFVFLGVVRRGNRNPCLVVLRQESIEGPENGLSLVASVDLSAELSCICIPQWLDWAEILPDGSVSTNFPVILLGTYAPSIDVWSLEPVFKCASVATLKPWFSASPGTILSQQELNDQDDESVGCVSYADSERKRASAESGNFPDNTSVLGDNSRLGDSRQPHFMKTWNPQKILESCVMTCVPESLSAFESFGKRCVLAGLRNGNVLQFCFSDVKDASNRLGTELNLIARRRLGDVPVKLFRVIISTGSAVIAQAERPWVTSTESSVFEWFPMAFPETRSWCSYSAPGAEPCLATVSSDDVLHVCGLQRLSSVSVNSILVGGTPRRVVALHSPSDSFLVATCREPQPKPKTDSASHQTRFKRTIAPYESMPYSELKVFNKYTKRLIGGVKLNPGELVHTLLRFGDFVVVGTSIGLRSIRGSGPLASCHEGRVLLYSVRSEITTVPSGHSGLDGPARTERAAMELCSEIKMPGAALAGAVHPDHDMLVVSCNSAVIVFGLLQNALFEVTRAHVRLNVLSISINGPVVCVADRKDSVTFFRFDLDSRSLMRDGTDHRKRLVADAEMIDSHTAMVTDKFGGLFTICYDGKTLLPDDGDDVENGISMSDLVWNQLVINSAMDQRLIDEGSRTSSPFVDSMNEDAVGSGDSLLMRDDGSEEGGTDSHANFSDTIGGSHDETVQDAVVSVGTVGNSTTNDDFSEDIEVEEIEGASIVETAGTTEGHDMSMGDADGIDEGTMNDIDDDSMQIENENSVVGGQAAAPGTVAQATGENANGAGDDGDGGGVAEQPGTPPIGLLAYMSNSTSTTRRNSSLQRKVLVSEHNFNMRDAALRIRKAVFKRAEMIEVRGENARRIRSRNSIWEDKESSIISGTLSGSLVCAVPISAEALTLLRQIGYALLSHWDITTAAVLENNYEQYRTAYGAQSEGFVDGDLLQQFVHLSLAEKRQVCQSAGYSDEGIVFQVEALILQLCD